MHQERCSNHKRSPLLTRGERKAWQELDLRIAADLFAATRLAGCVVTTPLEQSCRLKEHIQLIYIPLTDSQAGQAVRDDIM